MLASIDENMPIWDSKVLDRIGIKSSNKRGQQKLEETIELYDVIVQWYDIMNVIKEKEVYYGLYNQRRFRLSYCRNSFTS